MPSSGPIGAMLGMIMLSDFASTSNATIRISSIFFQCSAQKIIPYFVPPFGMTLMTRASALPMMPIRTMHAASAIREIVLSGHAAMGIYNQQGLIAVRKSKWAIT